MVDQFFNLDVFDKMRNFSWSYQIIIFSFAHFCVHQFLRLQQLWLNAIQILEFAWDLYFVRFCKVFNGTNRFKKVFAIFYPFKELKRNFWFDSLFFNNITKLENELLFRFYWAGFNLIWVPLFGDPYFTVLTLIEHDHFGGNLKKSKMMTESFKPNHGFFKDVDYLENG